MFGRNRKKAVAVVRRYIDALNARDAAGMKSVLHGDCTFVDSHGFCVSGYEHSAKAIDNFLELDPTFRIQVDTISTRSGELLMRGRVDSRHPALRGDTLWTVKVEDGKLIYWQSFGQSESLALRLLPEAAYPCGEAVQLPPQYASA